MLRTSLIWTLVFVAALALGAAPASAGRVELISKAGTPGPAHAVGQAGLGFDMSGDGRFVVFLSTSPNLAPGQSDGNDQPDVFLWDRNNGEIRLVSHRSGSAAATTDYGVDLLDGAQISADGRWIAFCSAGTGLISNQEKPTWPTAQIYLYDRDSDTTTLVSRSISSPTWGGNFDSCRAGFSLSSDGRYLAFDSLANDLVPITGSNNFDNVYLYDRVAGTMTLASHSSANASQRGNGTSNAPTISADGRWVAYMSTATDLAAGLVDNGTQLDVFLFDRTTGGNVLVSHASGSSTTAADNQSDSPKISADGAWIAFTSSAGNLVAGQSDPATAADIFLWERSTGTTRLVSHASGSATTAGNASSPGYLSISADGAWIAFESNATDLAAGATDANGDSDIYLFDRSTGANTLVSHAPGSLTAADDESRRAVLTPDGSRVFLFSRATNLVTGVTDSNAVYDLFAWSRADGTVTLINHIQGDPTVPGGVYDIRAVPADDGLSVLFLSAASNLTGSADTNGGSDLFLHDLGTGANIPASFSPAVVSATAGGESRVSSNGASLSADGRFIAFVSSAPDLVPGQVDLNQSPVWYESGDLFLYDRAAQTMTLVSHGTASPTTTGNKYSSESVISRDGRYVAFLSQASDLVPGQVDNTTSDDVFLFDRVTGSITLVSHFPSSSSTQATCLSFCSNVQISDDGRYVAYQDGSFSRIYDRDTGTYASVPSDLNAILQLSGDGRVLAVATNRANVLPGQVDTNGATDVFLYDRVNGTTVLASRSASSPTTTGNGAVTTYPYISRDGRFVVFGSQATNHVSGQIDTNNEGDFFLFDRDTGTVTLVSHAAGFSLTAGQGRSDNGIISKDGRFVFFASSADDLLPGQQDTPTATFDNFLWDRLTGATSLVSHRAGSLMATANQGGGGMYINADGSRLVFWSESTDLIEGLDDANVSKDLFVYDRFSGSLELVTRTAPSPGTTANMGTLPHQISEDGQVILFSSQASDLVAGDYNLAEDVLAFVPEDLDFYTLAPCRLFDSRRPEDGPALTAGVATIVEVNGACGVPTTARALAVNVTVIEASALGYLTLYPGDGLPPVASTLNFLAGLTRANNALVRLAPSGNGTLAVRPMINGGGSVHVIIDVVGYFE